MCLYLSLCVCLAVCGCVCVSACMCVCVWVNLVCVVLCVLCLRWVFGMLTDWLYVGSVLLLCVMRWLVSVCVCARVLCVCVVVCVGCVVCDVRVMCAMCAMCVSFRVYVSVCACRQLCLPVGPNVAVRVSPVTKKSPSHRRVRSSAKDSTKVSPDFFNPK